MSTISVFMDVKEGIVYTDIPLSKYPELVDAMNYETPIKIPTHSGDVTISGKFIYAIKEVK